jgi:hypothetical protein
MKKKASIPQIETLRRANPGDSRGKLMTMATIHLMESSKFAVGMSSRAKCHINEGRYKTARITSLGNT